MRYRALAILLALIGGASSIAGAQGTRPRTMYEDLQMLSGVLNQLRANHPDSLDAHELIMAGIEGMVHAADPHSYVIVRARLDSAKERAWRDNKLYPVGISFSYSGGAPVVVGVAPGSNAAQQDILPGDELIAIDGIPVRATSETELEIALGGPRNSTVRLVFERERSDGSVVQLPRDVKREKLDEETAVPAAFMLGGGAGYLRLTSFDNEKVADDVRNALGRLEKAGMSQLVLDLRDNPGGMVREASSVAGEFLPGGSVVYMSSGRKSDVGDTVKVTRWFRGQKKYPLVVMINEGSASAAELLAGALQDHDRALVYGRPSFGKSLLMQGFPLPDGSLFVMVVGQVKTPCGRVIQREYRGISRHDYYRRARAERDTLGRPSCRTDGGRTVYGGGGIYPDVQSSVRWTRPAWASQIGEAGLATRWAAAQLSDGRVAFASLDELAAAKALPAAQLADFRAFAARQGVTVPEGAQADASLQRLLTVSLARVKFGEAGYYRLSALLDPEVEEARGALTRAGTILGASTR